VDSLATEAGSLPQDPRLDPPVCRGIETRRCDTLRRRRDLGALALAGVGVIVFLVVLVITARPGGHTANALELAVQILVVAGAVLLVAGRMTRRG
jgi:hypothetical protein